MKPATYNALAARLAYSNSGYIVTITKLDETLPGIWVVTFDCKPIDPDGLLGPQTLVRLSTIELVGLSKEPREINGIIVGYRRKGN